MMSQRPEMVRESGRGKVQSADFPGKRNFPSGCQYNLEKEIAAISKSPSPSNHATALKAPFKG